TDYQVYTPGKELVISFPSLEVGDVLDVKWTTRGRNPEHQGHFFTRYTFGDDRYPVVLDELRVRLPRDQQLRYASIGGQVKPTIEHTDETTTYLWQVRDRRQLPQETDGPSKEELRLQVVCSTFRSWDDVGRWTKKLRGACWECTPAIQEIVQDVTRDLDDPLDKARALTYWVRRHVRYVSSGTEHDYKPHPPATVLANRYGDCKDQTQLLAVMLRAAGIPTALATIGTQGDGQVIETVPSPWGTHALLLVTIDDQDHWIDTTARGAGWNFLPDHDRDRLAYVVGDDGIRLLRTPPLTPLDNRIEQITVVSIGADGSTRSERTLQAHGLAALERRDEWLEVPSGERRRLMTRELLDTHGQARLRALTIEEAALTDFDKPVTAHVVFEIAEHFRGDPEPEGSVTDSPLWSRLLYHTLAPERQTPLDLGHPFESRHRYVIHLPPAYRLSDYPDDHEIESPWGIFRLNVRVDEAEPRRIELNYHTRLHKTRVVPADFESFQRFQEEVARHYRVWLTLRPANDLADLPLLASYCHFVPADRESAIILARLLLRHGFLSQAGLVLRRARFFHPLDQILAEMVVETADQPRAREEAYRELVRLFPQEAAYRVALGRALGERGDHAGARKVLWPASRKGPAYWRATAHYELARGWFAQDMPENALKHLDMAANADPAVVFTSSALVFKGRIHEQLRQLDAATDAYRTALRLNEKADAALARLIELSLAAKDKKSALDYVRRYTILATGDADMLALAADWHWRLNRPDDALELAQRSGDLAFTPLAHLVMGLVHEQRGEFEKAAQHLEQAGLAAPALAGLIRSHIALGNLRQAEDQALRAERLAKNHADLASTCALVPPLTQRRAAILKTVTMPPDEEEAWTRAVDAFVCAEYAWDVEGAVARVGTLLAKACRDDTPIGPAFALRGLLALEKGRLSRALHDAEHAIRLSPDDPRGWYVRGRVLWERGEEQALADLTAAVEKSQRKDAAILHWLAAAHLRRGQHDSALALQRDAVRLAPDNAEFTEQLRAIEKTQPTPRK
ncbi:MAG: DUF3857 domain-containing protein, partial [Gemmataceae bacterium]